MAFSYNFDSKFFIKMAEQKILDLKEPYTKSGIQISRNYNIHLRSKISLDADNLSNSASIFKIQAQTPTIYYINGEKKLQTIEILSVETPVNSYVDIDDDTYDDNDYVPTIVTEIAFGKPEDL